MGDPGIGNRCGQTRNGAKRGRPDPRTISAALCTSLVANRASGEAPGSVHGTSIDPPAGQNNGQIGSDANGNLYNAHQNQSFDTKNRSTIDDVRILVWPVGEPPFRRSLEASTKCSIASRTTDT